MTTIQELLGEQFTPAMPYGENMSGDLVNGYTAGEAIDFVPATTLGNGVQGPPQQQDLQIWRDNRPLAVDELGMEGPWVLPWVMVSHPDAGKTFPLNLDWGMRFDRGMPGLVPQEEPGGLLSPFPVVTWASTPSVVEVLPTSGDVVYSTAGEGI